MSQHALASPSSAGMWMNCPASITKAGGRSRPSSKYAREGSAAHAIAQHILEVDPFPPQRLTIEGETIIVSRDMLRYLNRYISYVEGLQKKGGTVLVETRVALQHTKGLLWGTADCIGLSPDEKVMVVADLKYGRGVPVPANEAQFKIYALCAMDHLRVFPDLIYLTVFQPRLDPDPLVHVMTFQELMDWAASDLMPALKRVQDNDQTEQAGPWCRWCVRRDECVAFAMKKAGIASEIFDDGVDLTTA